MRRLRNSPLARNTGWMLLAQGGRLAAQAAYFVLIARALGVREFGALAAALAITAILVPFAGWGSGSVLVMNVARAPERLAVYLGNTLAATAATLVPLAALAVAAGAVFVPHLPWRALLLLAVADLLFGRVAETAAQCFQALERMRASAAVALLPSLFRLAAAAAFVAAGAGSSAAAWAPWYAGAMGGAAAATAAVVFTRLGRPRLDARLALAGARDGGLFSVGLSTSTVYADVDKTMLARLATLEAAGVYAAAYRAVSMAVTPIMALCAAAYARFFRAGTEGVRGSLGLAQRLLPASAGYGVAAGVAMFALAPLAPAVLGDDYGATVEALRWLAALPLLQAVSLLAGDALTGAGRQGARSSIQVGVVALNVGLNLWLIPLYSWQGAAWATLASYAVLAAALWAVASLFAGPARARVAT